MRAARFVLAVAVLAIAALAAAACGLDGLAGGGADATLDGAVAEAGRSTDAEVGPDAAFDSATLADGGARDAAAAVDAGDSGDAAPRCNPATPFGAPTEVTELSSAYFQGQLRLLDDDLTGYFVSNRKDAGAVGIQAFLTTRQTPSAPFGAPTLIESLSPTGADNYGVSMSGDGLLAHLSSTLADGGGGSSSIRAFVTTRPSALAPFTTPWALVDWPSAGSPFVTAAGDAVYYAGPAGGMPGELALYRAPLGPGGAPGLAAAVPLNGVSAAVRVPVVTRDETLIFFAAYDPTLPGAGVENSYEIWTASRAKPGDPFGGARPVTELNSTALDMPSWVDPTGCVLYLSSSRPPAGSGRWRIFVARRSP